MRLGKGGALRSWHPIFVWRGTNGEESPHEYWVSSGRIRTQPVEMTSDPYPTRAVPVPVVREVGRDRERARVRHRYREVDDKTCCVVQPFFARPTH